MTGRLAWPSRASGAPPRLRRLSLLLLLPLLVGGLFGAPSTPVAVGDDLSDAVAQQRALEARVKAQKAQVARLDALQDELAADIRSTKKALADVNADLSAVRKQIARTKSRITLVQAAYVELVKTERVQTQTVARLQAQEARAARRLAERKDLLAERIRSAYDANRTSLLETVLSGDSFTDVLAQVSYFEDVGEQDKALAQEIVRQQVALASLHQLVLEERAQTQFLRDEKRAQKLELDAALADLATAQKQLRKLERETQAVLARQKAAFAKAKRNEAALRAAIAAEQEAERKLEARIEELLRQQYAAGNIPPEYEGSLAWPLAGQITQEFGCTGFEWEPPLGACAHFHRGIDIAAPMYTPIEAAGNGTVLFAGPNPYDPYPKAWVVVIAHSQSLITWYGHVDNATKPPTVRAGDLVREGEVIAYVGMTGRTTGPHLHWGVQLYERFVNPRLLL